ncbi:MAG: LEA type 2 family protein [Phycisphaerales bacterium]
MHTLILSILSAVLLLAPVGCAKNYAAPTFDAVGVQESVQTDGLSILTFDIEATNPNREPMALGQATYTLSLDGTDVFTGVRSPESTLHTFSSHTFSLPAVIPADLISSTGEIPYRLRGTVIYKNPGALADVLFDAEVIVPEATLDLDGTINLGQ